MILLAASRTSDHKVIGSSPAAGEPRVGVTLIVNRIKTSLGLCPVTGSIGLHTPNLIN